MIATAKRANARCRSGLRGNNETVVYRSKYAVTNCAMAIKRVAPDKRNEAAINFQANRARRFSATRQRAERLSGMLHTFRITISHGTAIMPSVKATYFPKPNSGWAEPSRSQKKTAKAAALMVIHIKHHEITRPCRLLYPSERGFDSWVLVLGRCQPI